MGILTQSFEKRAHPSSNTNWALYGLTPPNGSYTGKSITEENALDSTAFFNGVRIISETIASLPLHLYQRTGAQGKKRAVGQPEYDLLHTAPNPYMTSMAFREAAGVNLCTWGNFYAEKQIDGYDRVVGLWPLLPKDMASPKWINDDLVYAYNLPDGGTKIFTRRNLLHIVGFSPNGLSGYNIVKKGQEAIALGLALEEYAARYFGNGARPAAVLEHPENLSQEAQGRFRTAWEDMHKGLSNSHRVAILEEGMKLHEWGSSPGEAQAIEARKFQVVEVARILNLPVHLLKDLDRATNNNIEHQSLEFVTFCLRPWLVRIEQTYNMQILTEKQRKKYFYEHLIDGLLRGDAKTRHETYSAGRQWGYYSANDIREMENKNPIDGGDVYYMPFNMMNLKDAGKTPPKQPAPNEPPEGEDDQDEQKNTEGFEVRSGGFTRSIKQIETSYYPLILDAAQRIVNKETKAVNSAIDKHLGTRGASGFGKWMDAFYLAHGDYVSAVLGPILRSYQEVVAKEAGVLIGGDIIGSGDMNKFFDDYIENYTKNYIGSSSGQLKKIIEDMPVTELGPAIKTRMDEWYEKRAGKTAMDEKVRASNASAHETFKRAGVKKIRWVTHGTNCPFCNAFSGRVVGVEENFLDSGQVLYVGPDGKYEIKSNDDAEKRAKGWQALKSYGAKMHPPIHRGCDCSLSPEL